MTSVIICLDVRARGKTVPSHLEVITEPLRAKILTLSQTSCPGWIHISESYQLQAK